MDIEAGLSTAPDLESSTPDYASRFSGPAGKWLLEVQDEATRQALQIDPVPRTVLEPGGAHAQNIGVLAVAGCAHTILASPGCPADMIQRDSRGENVQIIRSSLGQLSASDQSYDAVLSYRIMAHINDWRAFVAELCRVSSHAVIVDYPTLRSFNVMTESMYRYKQGVEQNTRPYRIFDEAELVAEFDRCGFTQVFRYGQFFWPMALHRGLGKPGVSRWLERVPGALGLRQYFGSPVIARFERRRTV